MTSTQSGSFNPRIAGAASLTVDQRVPGDPIWMGFNPRIAGAASLTLVLNAGLIEQLQVSIPASPGRLL